jgi:branched-chain amino acid transport system ATP-binding protein
MMLEVSGLYVRYGLSEILKDVSLSVKQGDIVTLLGRNGMGKTTTLRTIMGLTSSYRGSVHFEGKPIQDSPSWRVAQLGIGYVPEGRQIFPNLTVQENLVATARTVNGRTWNESKIYDLFPRLGERSMNMGNQLSGGEQQMLAIGRALLTNPRLLILDEATEGLAPILRQEIWQCLEKLKSLGQSILIVDKNIKDLVKIANQHFVFERGRVVWSGDSFQLLSQKELIKTHLTV